MLSGFGLGSRLTRSHFARALTCEVDHSVVPSKNIIIRVAHFDYVLRDLIEGVNIGWVVPQLVVENLVVR